MSQEVTNPGSIKFSLPGIATLMAQMELSVPEYQRSYAWHVSGDDVQVAEYWNDLLASVPNVDREYFFGTIVLSRQVNSHRHVVIDGQQRLATTVLLLTAVRARFRAVSHPKARVLDGLLAKETMTSDGEERRLLLNLDDDDYLASIVADGTPPEPDRKIPSQKRLKLAYEFLLERVNELADTEGNDALIKVVTFLQNRARVGVIEVPTESDAYVIFETLNDRGADLTIADLLKNYLYGKAQDKLEAVKRDWAMALGALELTAADAKFVAFLRHYWSSREGVTRERELYASIQAKVKTKTDAAKFARSIAQTAIQYAALDNASHPQWAKHGTSGRADVALLVRFNLAPNRPLLMAAMDNFTQVEFAKLLQALVNWSVRGLINDIMNSGTTEEQYCLAAVEIRAKTITTVAQLRTFLTATVLPSDTVFEDAYSLARIKRNRNWLARYYLRALERQKVGEAEPALVPNPDENELNLEHVLPQNAVPADWTGVTSAEDVETWAYRLGNMVLLSKKENNDIGNGDFLSKVPVLKASALELTKEVGRKHDWTPKQIENRQKDLAKLAVKTWPR
ncbi:DUF262 domain-containing protein [Mycolicibacterium fortuitum]|uniref:GmrSD restriction endonuclease domain-containing protein n=1 Tax=Mycolicibacterium fortuitum TaxID=1766 RepID=UPI00148F9B8D|nr:DUF262 domain-containing protein [Mycolicibacterium fortuitum]